MLGKKKPEKREISSFDKIVNVSVVFVFIMIIFVIFNNTKKSLKTEIECDNKQEKEESVIPELALTDENEKIISPLYNITVGEIKNKKFFEKEIEQGTTYAYANCKDQVIYSYTISTLNASRPITKFITKNQTILEIEPESLRRAITGMEISERAVALDITPPKIISENKINNYLKAISESITNQSLLNASSLQLEVTLDQVNGEGANKIYQENNKHYLPLKKFVERKGTSYRLECNDVVDIQINLFDAKGQKLNKDLLKFESVMIGHSKIPRDIEHILLNMNNGGLMTNFIPKPEETENTLFAELSKYDYTILVINANLSKTTKNNKR